MENATQALLMAAGVLIGIIILSMAVYLVNVFGGYSANMQTKITENQMAQFNANFLQYDGLSNLTIQDVITAKNYALESNYNQDPNYDYNTCLPANDNTYIDVYYKVNNVQRRIFEYTDEELLKDNIDNKRSFTCTVEVNSNTGLVQRVTFVGTESI